MARRHFNIRGFPKLDKIIREICGYVEGLEVEYTDHQSVGNVVDSKKTKYGNRIVSSSVDFFQGIPTRPFKVNGIYVVGGQFAYLPESYNTGHDLDMVVKTNADRVTFSPDVESDICCELSNILNNGNGCWTDRDTEKFALHLFDKDMEENPLKPPYLQIYPTMERVFTITK